MDVVGIIASDAAITPTTNKMSPPFRISYEIFYILIVNNYSFTLQEIFPTFRRS